MATGGDASDRSLLRRWIIVGAAAGALVGLLLTAGIALGIGSKIGTCVTAVLAGLGKPAEARRVGVVHVLFNLLGALMWIPFIDGLGAMATAVSPAFPELEGIERLAAETPRQVANAITIFALINLGVMIWFTRPIAALAEKIVPDKPVEAPEKVEPKRYSVELGAPAKTATADAQAAMT